MIKTQKRKAITIKAPRQKVATSDWDGEGDRERTVEALDWDGGGLYSSYNISKSL